MYDGRMGEKASFCFPISFPPTKTSHYVGKILAIFKEAIK